MQSKQQHRNRRHRPREFNLFKIRAHRRPHQRTKSALRKTLLRVTPFWLINDAKEKDWVLNLFSSVAAPPQFYQAFLQDPTDIDVGRRALLQLSCLQAEQLPAYAMQLMYNGGQGFTSEDELFVSFQNPKVTESVAITVITLGMIRAEIPIVPSDVWAIVGSLLGLLYGVRGCWSLMDTLCLNLLRTYQLL
jgi:hypothetical protein